MKKNDESKGITLIALVVTIVVLLILAAVSISMLTGENGIITQAQESSIKTENGEVYEALLLKITDNNFNNITSEDYTNALDYLLSEGYIDSNNIVNVKNVTERNMKTGNGSNDKDIYKIEDGNLYYYDKNGEKTELGDLFENKIAGKDPTPEEYFDFDSTTGGIAIKNADSYYGASSTYDSTKTSPIEEVVIPKYYNGKEVTSIGVKYANKYTFIAGFSTPNIKRIYMSNNILKLENRVNTEQGLFEIPTLEEIVLSDNIEYLPGRTFAGCKNLNNIKLPSKLKNIGTDAFLGCSSLTSIEIPNEVISIGFYAFEGCSGLKSIEISNRIINIKDDAFKGCDNLKTVIYKGSKEDWEKIIIGRGNEDLINAEIIYDNSEYENSANDYVSNKNQEELEELMLKSIKYLGTFDELLAENSTTRKDLEQAASELYMSYIEYLKYILIYSPDSWLNVEYQVTLQGGEGKSIEELEKLFIEKNGGQENFENLLKEQGVTKEQYFENICNTEGFRTKEDFLKYRVYYER